MADAVTVAHTLAQAIRDRGRARCGDMSPALAHRTPEPPAPHPTPCSQRWALATRALTNFVRSFKVLARIKALVRKRCSLANSDCLGVALAHPAPAHFSFVVSAAPHSEEVHDGANPAKRPRAPSPTSGVSWTAPTPRARPPCVRFALLHDVEGRVDLVQRIRVRHVCIMGRVPNRSGRGAQANAQAVPRLHSSTMSCFSRYLPTMPGSSVRPRTPPKADPFHTRPACDQEDQAIRP